MSHPLILTSLAAIILASSCDKPGILNKERAKIEAQIQHTSDEMRSIDEKFDTLRTAHASDGMTLERLLDEAVKKNVILDSELADLSKKCAEAEASLSEFRPRLDTYKAKYLY